MIRRRITTLFMGLGILFAALGATAITHRWRRALHPHPVTGKPIVLPGVDGDSRILHNGWRITPVGRHIPTNDMLLGGAISPDGKTLAVANCGYNAHRIHLIDIATEKEITQLVVPTAWNGIAWSPDGNSLYVGSGCAVKSRLLNQVDDVYLFHKKEDGSWERGDGFNLKGNDRKTTCITGISLSKDGSTLYILNNTDNNLYVLDVKSGNQLTKVAVGESPIVERLSADGTRLYVANWGGASYTVLNVSTSSAPKVMQTVKTDSHPNDLALSSDDRLFVSCGSADVVQVFDTRTNALLEQIRTAISPKAPYGSTPNALALTGDNRSLYVANADNNNVCVIEVLNRGKSRVRGFIPTGWYPSAVMTTPDSKRVIIGSGKGLGTTANKLISRDSKAQVFRFEHHGKQLKGFLSFVNAPDDAELANYTRMVMDNTPYRDEQLRVSRSAEKTAIPTRIGAKSPIKYVLYIIKENRTYDQVFGDIPQGNGDKRLVLFGREVTPNQHALADEYVLLDNLYCSGEVSADGHPWSTSAIATDYTQRSWVLNYSGKDAPKYTDSLGDPKSGYIWDACAKKGLSYRSYGEYVYATSSESAPEQKVAATTSLIGHGSPAYVGIGRPKNAEEMRDTEKADVFIAEFKEFEKKGTLPRFMIMALGENHTHGTATGQHTPRACVASNDYALGKIVDAISHSSVWKETAIFVIEDDAQNGPDHVDSHRTPGLVISPYTKRKYVDSTMYNTTSMLRTMELILGLPPMTQYDASATPLFASFTNIANTTPFNVLKPTYNLAEMNAATAYGVRESNKMDFRGYDRVDEDTLNRILWHSIRGARTPLPTPSRSAMITPEGRVSLVHYKERDTDD